MGFRQYFVGSHQDFVGISHQRAHPEVRPGNRQAELGAVSGPSEAMMQVQVQTGAGAASALCVCSRGVVVARLRRRAPDSGDWSVCTLTFPSSFVVLVVCVVCANGTANTPCCSHVGCVCVFMCVFQHLLFDFREGS